MTTGALRQPEWMTHAWGELGQREVAGRGSNARIADYFRRVGHPDISDDAVPWCAAFVGACLERAGIASTQSLLARSYLDWGAPALDERPGAIAVLTRGTDPAAGHVGFLVGATPDGIFLLGGNQSDAVSIARFDRSRLIALRLPEPTAAAVKPATAGQAQFDWSLSRILDFEGGWTDDPFDPGGPTNKGITLAVYARERGDVVSAQTMARLRSELRDIPDDLVRHIYLQRYWRPAQCDALQAPLAHFHFDATVNQGLTGAAKLLQQALGVAVDGEIGPITLGAAEAQPVDQILSRYAAARRRHYRSLSHFWRFGRGWLARVDTALAQARMLITDPPRHASPPASPHPPRIPRKDATTMPSDPLTDFETTTIPAAPGKWWGQSLTIWGVIITAITTVMPTVFSAFGLDIPAELINRLGSDAASLFQAVGGLFGTLMAIVGRARADSPLARRPLQVRL
ncbi:MAG: TIGR02594 family protein [Hyphomicrobiaceae bacterium]